MKVLHVSGSTDIGGAERVLARLARGLRQQRPDWTIEALVLCRYGHGGLAQEYRDTYHEVLPGPALYEESQKRIMALIEERHYDLVHCIDSHHLTRMAAQWMNKTPFIQNVFPNVATSPFAPPKEWMENQNLPYAALVTEFKANADRLPRLPRGEVLSIPNGIDTEFWTPELCRRDIDVVWCARTDAEKGIDLAMELAPLLWHHGLRYGIITSEADGPVDRLCWIRNMYSRQSYRRAGRLRCRAQSQRSPVCVPTHLHLPIDEHG